MSNPNLIAQGNVPRVLGNMYLTKLKISPSSAKKVQAIKSYNYSAFARKLHVMKTFFLQENKRYDSDTSYYID